jgi:hypothetical protein
VLDGAKFGAANGGGADQDDHFVGGRFWGGLLAYHHFLLT